MSDLKRPDCFEFAMDFLGNPEEPIIRAYVEQLEAKVAEIEKGEPVAYMSRSKMTDYAISLLPTRIARETEIAKGWSEWHPVDNEKYKFYLNSIGKSDWLSDYEFIPLYTSPQPIEKCEPELYMAKNLHNKSYATSRSEAEARLFLLQSGLKVDGIESEVIPLCRCDTSPQPRKTDEEDN